MAGLAMTAPTLFDGFGPMGDEHGPTVCDHGRYPDERCPWCEPLDARGSDPETSKLAGRQAAKGRTKNQENVLQALRANPDGLTDHEVGALVGLIQTSAGKRRLELQRAGLVVKTDETRKTPSGAWATVWKAVA